MSTNMMIRNLPATIFITVALPAVAAPPLPSVFYPGIDLQGLEYANGNPNAVFNTNYTAPTPAEVSYYHSLGFRSIRLGVEDSRIQPTNLAPLNANELAHINPVVKQAKSFGMWVYIDVHDYGQMWNSATGAMGSIGVPGGVSNKIFADMWKRLAKAFKSYPNAVFELMNEPHAGGITNASWKASAVAAVKAIRAAEDPAIRHVILVQGAHFDTARTWTIAPGRDVSNADAWAGYADPVGGPWYFAMHDYLNAYDSGPACPVTVGAGSTRLVDATKWLAANGYQAILSEFSWCRNTSVEPNVNDPQAQTEGSHLIQFMASNSGQWVGWNWFGSGPWVGNKQSGTNLDPGADPQNPGEQVQMPTLIGH